MVEPDADPDADFPDTNKDVPSRMFPRITGKRKKLIHAAIENPGATNAELAEASGYGNAEKVRRALKHPHVSNILHHLLDQYGAELDDSARVIGDAHRARKVKEFQSKGRVVRGKVKKDHDIRLRGAEMALKLRGKLKDPGVEINLYDQLDDDQLAQIAAKMKTLGDFVDTSPGGAT